MCCRTYSAASAAASAGVGGALGALRGAEITAFPNVDAPLDAAANARMLGSVPQRNDGIRILKRSTTLASMCPDRIYRDMTLCRQ